MIWAVGFTFVAVFLGVGSPQRVAVVTRGSVAAAEPSVRATPRRLRAAAGVVPGLAGACLAGWAVGVAAALVGACVFWVVQRNAGRRSAALARAETVRSCQLLAGLLRVGLVPAAALRAAAADAPMLSEAAASAALGGEVATVLRRRRDDPGCRGLGEVANAWEVAEATGASMTASLDAVAARLAADAEVRQTVAAELSAPRATGRLLAVLPLAGLGVGYALGGDPASFLTGSWGGQLSLIGGVALGCAGVVWTELLAEKHGGG